MTGGRKHEAPSLGLQVWLTECCYDAAPNGLATNPRGVSILGKRRHDGSLGNDASKL